MLGKSATVSPHTADSTDCLQDQGQPSGGGGGAGDMGNVTGDRRSHWPMWGRSRGIYGRNIPHACTRIAASATRRMHSRVKSGAAADWYGSVSFSTTWPRRAWWLLVVTQETHQTKPDLHRGAKGKVAPEEILPLAQCRGRASGKFFVPDPLSPGSQSFL
jgi:hypothetical protein